MSIVSYCYCAKIQDWAAVILDFIFVQYFGMLIC